MKKKTLSNLIKFIGLLSGVGTLAIVIILIIIQNTISYEPVFSSKRILKSSLFVVMEHNPILGYSLIVLSVISAICTCINVYVERNNDL